MKKRLAVTVEEAQWGDGSIVRKSGSARLYFDFQYRGQRVEISTGLKDTPQNHQKARAWLDRQMEKMRDGSFKFAAAFPKASREKQELFARLEGTTITLKPQHVLFGDYVRNWYQTYWAAMDSETKKTDYMGAINSQILPFFQDLNFFQINRITMKSFVKQLRHLKGAKKGQQLSRRRVANICLPLRTIWHDACDEHRWDLPDPFSDIYKSFPCRVAEDEFDLGSHKDLQPISADRDPLRYGEFQDILENLDPWYRPIAELMAMTGMIASEMAGLTRHHLKDGFILVRRSVSRGVERIGNKTMFRRRDIRITKAIQAHLNVLLKRTEGRRLVSSKTGKFFTAAGFYKAWVKAERAAGVRHRVPYALRHTFAAWSLIINIAPLKLHKLMGHASKQMVYEVYGVYVERLEEDREEIRTFFGEDFGV